MAIHTKEQRPWGSKQRVTNAGNRVRLHTATIEDHAIIDRWREAHRHVINSFQAILRNRTRGTQILVAQRHKRKRTIIDKLHRFPKMQLGRMDDVAGCRLIFPTVRELSEFRETFHENSRFNHKLRNKPDKYDYLTRPKESGYRGIHDVYEYDVRSQSGSERKGLLIELQYRTVYQHAWATSVEMVGILTEDQPKFDQGDANLRNVLRFASEIIARAHEGMRSCLADLDDKEVVKRFLELDTQTNFLDMLRDLNAADPAISPKQNLILIFDRGESGRERVLEVKAYSEATVALQSLFELERDNPGMDIVLVKGNSPRDVREAFKNYFTDAREFLDLVEDGCTSLAGGKRLAAPSSSAKRNKS